MAKVPPPPKPPRGKKPKPPAAPQPNVASNHSKWSRVEYLTALGIMVAILATIPPVFHKELRQWLGLDSAPAEAPAEPTTPERNDGSPVAEEEDTAPEFEAADPPRPEPETEPDPEPAPPEPERERPPADRGGDARDGEEQRVQSGHVLRITIEGSGNEVTITEGPALQGNIKYKFLQLPPQRLSYSIGRHDRVHIKISGAGNTLVLPRAARERITIDAPNSRAIWR